MKHESMIIESDNVSHAWGRAFLRLLDKGVTRLNPLILQINVGDTGNAWEDKRFREPLNQLLGEIDAVPIEGTINTIIPHNLYNPKLGREKFYQNFLKGWPRLARCRKNQHGNYFLRLLSYPDLDYSSTWRKSAKSASPQLEYLIDGLQKPGLRNSALQAMLYYPPVDSNGSALLGFPCLQSIHLTKCHDDSTFTLTAIYPSQHLVTRGYGNYIGLILLGKFLEQESGVRLSKFICLSSQATLGNDLSKHSCASLRDEISSLLPQD